jgi:hypothetical protein
MRRGCVGRADRPPRGVRLLANATGPRGVRSLLSPHPYGEVAAVALRSEASRVLFSWWTPGSSHCYLSLVDRKRCYNRYALKIRMLGPIRFSATVSLRGDRTLSDLHSAICIAFNRHDDGVYSFYFPKAEIGGYVPGLYPREYVSDVLWERPASSSRDQPSNAAKTKLDSLHLLLGQTFEYLFDFGDSSLHEIKVVAKHSYHPKKKLQAAKTQNWEAPQRYFREEDERQR